MVEFYFPELHDGCNSVNQTKFSKSLALEYTLYRAQTHIPPDSV